MKVDVVNADNKKVGSLELNDEVFGGRVNSSLIWASVVHANASVRRGTHKTKNRANVAGSGRKPWKQKGTGRARAGSSRSPIWKGGGVALGPQPRSYAYRLPRSARKAALASALAQKARDGQVRVVANLNVGEPKTKIVRQALSALGITGSVLIVCADQDRNLELGARNLPYTTVMRAAGLNVYDVLKHEILLIQRDALAAIGERCES